MPSIFFRKRSVYLPTWKLSLFLVALGTAVLFGIFRFLYPFLSQTDFLDRSDVIVIDGWVSDQTMEAALAFSRQQSCKLLLSAGGDLGRGYKLSEHKTYAHIGEATLEALGVPPDQVHPAPAGANHRHRTFASASAVYQWMEMNGYLDARITVITEGPHSRRSLAVYRKVFSNTEAEIGVISKPSLSYDPEVWWKTSEGLKSVVIETIAVAYEWLRDSGRTTNDPHSVQTGINEAP